jgi:hypothetical protein
MRLKTFKIHLLALIFLAFHFFIIAECTAKIISEKIVTKNYTIACTGTETKNFLPITDDKGIFKVGIGIVPLGITKFNLKESSAEVDFYLTIEYLLKEKVNNITCVGDDASNVWKIFYNPDIEFMNIPNPEYLQGWHWLVQDNRFIYMTRVRGTAFIDGSFHKFPFDKAQISFSTSG